MANINVRIEDDLKREGEEVLKSLGLNTATAINMYFRQIVYHGGIPFEVKRNSSDTITERMQGYRSGNVRLISKSIDELEAMENE